MVSNKCDLWTFITTPMNITGLHIQPQPHSKSINSSTNHSEAKQEGSTLRPVQYFSSIFTNCEVAKSLIKLLFYIAGLAQQNTHTTTHILSLIHAGTLTQVDIYTHILSYGSLLLPVSHKERIQFFVPLYLTTLINSTDTIYIFIYLSLPQVLICIIVYSLKGTTRQITGCAVGNMTGQAEWILVYTTKLIGPCL